MFLQLMTLLLISCHIDQFVDNGSCVNECASKQYFKSRATKQNTCIQTDSLKNFTCIGQICILDCQNSQKYQSHTQDICVSKCEQNQYKIISSSFSRQCGVIEDFKDKLVCSKLLQVCVDNCSETNQFISNQTFACTHHKSCFNDADIKKYKNQTLYQTLLFVPSLNQSFCAGYSMEIKNVIANDYENMKFLQYDLANMSQTVIQNTTIKSYNYNIVDKCSKYFTATLHPRLIQLMERGVDIEDLMDNIIFVCADKCTSKYWMEFGGEKLCLDEKQNCQSKSIIKKTGECVDKCGSFYVVNKGDQFKECYQKCPAEYKRYNSTSMLCVKQAKAYILFQTSLIIGILISILLISIVILKMYKKYKQNNQRCVKQVQLMYN